MSKMDIDFSEIVNRDTGLIDVNEEMIKEFMKKEGKINDIHYTIEKTK